MAAGGWGEKQSGNIVGVGMPGTCVSTTHVGLKIGGRDCPSGHTGGGVKSARGKNKETQDNIINRKVRLLGWRKPVSFDS